MNPTKKQRGTIENLCICLHFTLIFTIFSQFFDKEMVLDYIFERKIYEQILQWKQENNGKSALLIEGARRIGKSTIVEMFAKREYKSYILIDFNKASEQVLHLFDDLMDLDYIFLFLQSIYHTTLYQRESLIIFYEYRKSVV